MPKVVLVGGSSEIGLAIVKQIQFHKPTEYKRQILVSTTLNGIDCIPWEPRTARDVEQALTKIQFERGDVAIIAIGKLSGVGIAQQVGLSEIENTVNVNLELPLYSLLHCYKHLQACGGGRIIVLSSMAAFPVLPPNLFYGAMKNSLDLVARSLQESEKNSKVQISIVRSGFVPTKLNLGRTATPFSLTAEAVARIVYRKLGKKIIWTPWFLIIISKALFLSQPLREMASKKILRSLPS
jgi:decaprenylphospho-beta-D-erythro-pentofuranosid-2-ulose 2-reductase